MSVVVDLWRTEVRSHDTTAGTGTGGARCPATARSRAAATVFIPTRPRCPRRIPTGPPSPSTRALPKKTNAINLLISTREGMTVGQTPLNGCQSGRRTAPKRQLSIE